jgi:transcriptional regulator with PAS, ATPase and Fis domain
MSIVDSLVTQSGQAFQLIDEPDVGILVLDREMKVAWANARIMSLLDARKEEILGHDARRVLKKHLFPHLRDIGEAGRLFDALNAGNEVSDLDLPVRGREERIPARIHPFAFPHHPAAPG